MKKKLYFDNKIDTDIDFSIEIHGGKIRNFKGYNMHDVMLDALLNGKTEGEIRLLNIETKSDFTLEKLTKYDNRKFGISANYRIESKEISQYTLRGAYVKLNFIEYTQLKFDKKETVFHNMNITEKIITAFIFPLIVGILILYLTVYSTKENKKNTKTTFKLN